MAMMVQGSERIADADLPVAELAALMRLPDGYGDIPGQTGRLQAGLRAAIETIEARTGRILVARDVTLVGGAEGGARVTLGLVPVQSVRSIVARGVGGSIDLGPATVEAGAHTTTLALSRSVGAGTDLILTVAAGYSSWQQLPSPLREAVLLSARDIEEGVRDGAAQISCLISPYRPRRIGGSI